MEVACFGKVTDPPQGVCSQKGEKGEGRHPGQVHSLISWDVQRRAQQRVDGKEHERAYQDRLRAGLLDPPEIATSLVRRRKIGYHGIG